MKKVIVSTTLLGLALSATSVFAEAGEIAVPTLYSVTATTAVTASTSAKSSADIIVPATPEVTSVGRIIEKEEIIKTTVLSKMKARGLQLIKERINFLKANSKPIANSNALTADQKTVFATFFSGKITELTTLGSTISSSTDATTTKSLISSIFTDFRIYGVLVPQIRLQKRIYELQNHTTKLTETFTKIQTRIDEFKAKSKDVTVWQKNLDEAKVLVTTDTQKLSALLTQISALKPSDYGTTSKMTIEAVNKGVREVARDFQSINKKVKRPEFLRTNKTVNVNATTTASTTVR